jgi:hypothetical protein
MGSSETKAAAFMVVGVVRLKSKIRSLACISSESTHESWAGEYPFQWTRYCFFRHLPNSRSFRILSTSHSGVSSMMSGGGSR